MPPSVVAPTPRVAGRRTSTGDCLGAGGDEADGDGRCERIASDNEERCFCSCCCRDAKSSEARSLVISRICTTTLESTKAGAPKSPSGTTGRGSWGRRKWEQSVRQRLCVRACGQCILSTAGSKKWGRGGGGASLALVSRPAASARVRSRSKGGGATRKLVRQATSRTWRTTLNSERVCVCVCVGVTTHGSRRAYGSSTI